MTPKRTKLGCAASGWAATSRSSPLTTAAIKNELAQRSDVVSKCELQRRRATAGGGAREELELVNAAVWMQELISTTNALNGKTNYDWMWS